MNSELVCCLVLMWTQLLCAVISFGSIVFIPTERRMWNVFLLIGEASFAGSLYFISKALT